MISFKGCHFLKPIILHAIYFYLRYSVSLRNLEEILAKRKVRGQWMYLYHTADRDEKTLDFMRFRRRNTASEAQFFAKALVGSGIPLRIVIEKSEANGAGIKEVNKILSRLGCPARIIIA